MSGQLRIARHFYQLLLKHLSWWPLDPFSFNGQTRLLPGNRRVAYYTSHFPILTQTFIRREIQALKTCNLPLEIFADSTGSLDLLDRNAKSLTEKTHYLLPLNKTALRSYMRHFFLKNPLNFANLFVYVVTHRYRECKNFRGDVSLFLKCLYLAGLLKEHDINHLHSPWANESAFVALVAAHLVGARFTLQARAYDLYRKDAAYALAEKFRNARSIVTNSKYNQAYIRTFLDESEWKKVKVFRNGIKLDEFEPPPRRPNGSKETRLLCVARLVEQKGLIYLLQACYTLKKQGYSFKCDIIGDSEPSFPDYPVRLRKLHRTLDLQELVFFHGAQSPVRVMESFRNAHIFVLPCVKGRDGSRDVTPNALIESMAMELPVVSTRISAIPEIVEDQVSGLLVEPNNADALADSVIRLIENHDLRLSLGKRARKRVEERFDLSKNALRYLKLFEGDYPN